MIQSMSGVLITPSVLYVQDKVEQASERLILSGALVKHRVYDLGLAEKECQARKDGVGKIV